MPNPNGSSECMKPWTRKITQEEWDSIFGKREKRCPSCHQTQVEYIHGVACLDDFHSDEDL